MRGRALVAPSILVAWMTAMLPSAVVRADDDAAPAEKPLTKGQAEAKKHYDRARELYKLGRYREAIAQLEAALKLDPEGAELLYNLGLVHERLGDIDEAVDAYKRYLRALGTDADPEEVKKIQGVIRRLQGAKDEIKAKEAQQTEHRFTPFSLTLALAGSASFLAGAIIGGVALHHDSQAKSFQVGSDGTVGDRLALVDKSKREAVVADVFGIVGLAALGASITLYFTSSFPKEDDPTVTTPQSASLRVFPLYGGGGACSLEVAF